MWDCVLPEFGVWLQWPPGTQIWLPPLVTGLHLPGMPEASPQAFLEDFCVQKHADCSCRKEIKNVLQPTPKSSSLLRGTLQSHSILFVCFLKIIALTNQSRSFDK